jgi:hypothetical protein
MPLYTFLHNLLIVLVQIANKFGLHKHTHTHTHTHTDTHRQGVSKRALLLFKAYVNLFRKHVQFFELSFEFQLG